MLFLLGISPEIIHNGRWQSADNIMSFYRLTSPQPGKWPLHIYQPYHSTYHIQGPVQVEKGLMQATMSKSNQAAALSAVVSGTPKRNL